MNQKFKTISMIRRRIKDTYEYNDFRTQWLPEVNGQYNLPTYVISALKVNDQKEVLSLALIDANLEQIYQEGERVKLLDLKRKDKIIEVADSQGFAELFIIKNFDKLSVINPLCSIHPLEKKYIPILVEAFEQANWSKPASIFEAYLQEQLTGTRLVWVAHVGNQIAGYITLNWQSLYLPFSTSNIPEIMDLNVLPAFRKAGIGTMLLDTAENEASTKSDIIGIGVGLYGGPDGGYGPAQRLYINRGYIPDGKGVTYHYQPIIPGNTYALDDYLVIWLTKKLG